MAPTADAVQTPTDGGFADIEAQFASGEAFKREEQFAINKLVELKSTAATDEWLKARQIDINSEAFQQAYGSRGLPCLLIGLLGIDVDYEYAGADHIKRVYIPMQGDRPDKFGQPKGRRSQLDIVSQAFTRVYGKPPFGDDNRAAMIGSIAKWGQHLGDAEVGGEQREWAWDVPRQLLPATFTYTGEIRVLKARDGAAGTGVGSIGTAVMSDEDAKAAILAAVVGLSIEDVEGAANAVFAIQGLDGKFYDQATQKNTLAQIHELGWITAVDGKVAAA